MKLCTFILSLALVLPALAEKPSFYKGPGLFSKRPSEMISSEAIMFATNAGCR